MPSAATVTPSRHQIRIVGPPERTRIRRAELREMKTVEDLAAGGDPVGFRRQLRRFDEGLRALLPHPVAIPFRFAAFDVDRVSPDFVDRRGVVLGFRIELRRGLHARDGQRPARERLVGPEPRHAGPRRRLGGERRDGRDRTDQQRKSTRHARQFSKSSTRVPARRSRELSPPQAPGSELNCSGSARPSPGDAAPRQEWPDESSGSAKSIRAPSPRCRMRSIEIGQVRLIKGR